MDIKYISEVFQNFAVGLGALLAGTAGLNFITDRIAKQDLETKIKKYQKQFPKSEINSKYELMNKDGMIYILVYKTKMKHWIQSSDTFLDLGFFWKDDIKPLNDEQFSQYITGENIWTRGKPGS